MTDEERLDLLDHARRCDVLSEENAKLRKRIDELSIAFESTVRSFRDLACAISGAPEPTTRGR